MRHIFLIKCVIVNIDTPILWPPDAKNWFLGKDSDAEKDWRQEEEGMKEDEMVGWLTDSVDMSSSPFRSWRWTGKPGVQQSTGSQRVRHNWATELSWPPMRGSDLSSWKQWSPLLTSPSFSLIFLYLQQIQVKLCHELCWNLLYHYRRPLVRTGGFKQ